MRENYDAIQESMRLWNKNGERLQSAETETARRMALETGRAGKTDLDWLEHLAGKMCIRDRDGTTEKGKTARDISSARRRGGCWR